MLNPFKFAAVRVILTSCLGAGIVLGGLYYSGYLNDDPPVYNYSAMATAGPPGIDEFRPLRVIPTPFPPITEFPVLAADDAQKKLHPSELVLGVVVNGKPRAYPINTLTGPRREILNDHLGDRAIAATW